MSRDSSVAKVILMTVLILLLRPVAASGAGTSSWSLSISSVSMEGELHTVQHTTGYDGTVEDIPFDDIPSSGNCYAIVSVRASKLDPTAGPLPVGEMELVIDGAGYSAVSPVSVFLGNHNYETFSSEQIITGSTGSVAFEVPESLMDSDGTGWFVRCGDGIASAPYSRIDNEVPFGSNYIDAQRNTEQSLSDYYESTGGATIENPVVVQDVYGAAPLTALAIFETSGNETVTVTVHGKDASGDITYPVQGESSHHEVPIFGLYAGYDNRVTLKAGDVKSDISIKTQPLPDSVECISKVASNGAQELGQLFVLQSPHQVVFDNNGDVRWYLSGNWTGKSLASDSSYPMRLDKDSSGFFYFRNPLTDSVYDDGVELVHMSWMGKVEQVISNPVLSPDHDLTLVDDNTMLFIQDGMDSKQAAIWKLDLTTGEAEPWLSMNDILDRSVAPSYSNAWDDVWHINSVQYIPDDNSLVISLRNQSMVIKVDVDTKEVEWAFTSAAGRNADGSTWARQQKIADRVILPAEGDGAFEWFYDQHHANVISYDASTGVMDIVLFDNGTYRYNFGDAANDDRYSRICRYRIDEKARTATLVYQYGKDRGSELYSWWYGSAQYVSDMDHYIGSFAVYNGKGNSHIIESDGRGGVVAEYQVERAGNGAYRATAFSLNGGLEDAGSSSAPGSEIHRWSPGYWQAGTAGPQGDESLCTISSLCRDASRLYVTGSASVSEGVPARKAELVADGPGGLFTFGVSVAGTGGRFYGMGIGLDSLPSGTYTLSLRAIAGDRTVDIPIGYTVTTGDSIASDVTVTTNIPDGGQQAVLETMAAQASTVPFADMVVTLDPFGISPLTAMVQFHTDDLCTVNVTVHGKTDRTDVSYDVEGSRLLHLIPIVGLYYNDSSLVTISITHQDGTVESKDVELKTGVAPNPSKMPSISVDYDATRVSDVAPGLTFCAPSGGSYYYAVDLEGDIRWYYAFSGNVGIDGVSFTDEGHLLVLDGSKASTAETNNFSAMEIDLLGREYRSYFLPHMSFHHDLKELPNGDFLALATDYTKSTINDVVVEFDPETGEIVRRWDMDEILGRYGISRLATPSFELPVLSDGDGEYNENWFHANAVAYLEDEDCMIVSSRHQSAVFKIDCKTGDVLWVLSDPSSYVGTKLEGLLLTPVDSNASPAESFEWQYGQHAVMVCSDGDLALFDNGNYRTKHADGRVLAPDNYSRVEKLHIDEDVKTVSLSWEWGRNLGSDHYCALIGDIDELGDSHYLSTFGGHCLTGPGGSVSDSSAAYIESSLFETVGDDVVWQLSSVPTSPIRSSAIYRAERVELTSLPYSYDNLSGSIWKGSAGDMLANPCDASAYSDGLDGVHISSMINEGNRITISGSVENAETIGALYLCQVSEGGEVSAPIELAQDGSFSASLTYGPGQYGLARKFYILADLANGGKAKTQLGVELAGFGATRSSIISGSSSMEMGEEQALGLVCSPSGSVDRNASWSTSDQSVADVDETGKVTAKKPGFAIITALSSDNGTSAQMVITVTGTVLDETSLSMRRGDDVALSIISVEGSASTDSVKWSSRDEDVATVDDHGVVHGVDKGLATICAEVDGKRLECEVDVSVGLEDGIYTITSKLRGNRVLDITGASTASGANAQLYSDNNSLAQLFRVTYQGDGKYLISALCSDKALDVQSGGMANGTNVWQYEQNWTDAQRWLIERDEDGWYSVVSALNGLALDVANGNSYDGANVQVYERNGTDAQKFSFSRRFQEGIYRIGIASNPSLVLDVVSASTFSGANVQLYKWNRSAAQMFLITYASQGGFNITPLCSGKVLDVQGGSPSNGANVQQYDENGTAAQRWLIRENPDGSHSIISAATGNCLDISGGILANESNVQTWEANGTPAQKFDLIPVSATQTIASSIDPSLVLDVAGGSVDSGANIQLYKRNGTKAQAFYISDLTSDGKRFIIPALGSRMSLDAASGGYQNGSNVWQYSVNGSDAQRWYLQSVGDGLERITVASSGLALDIPAANAFSGANVQVYSWNGSKAQKFQLE